MSQQLLLLYLASCWEALSDDYDAFDYDILDEILRILAEIRALSATASS